MGIVSSAAWSGFGQGLAQLGGMMQKDQYADEARADKLALERERLAQAKEIALEKIQAQAAGGGKDPMAAKIAAGTDLVKTYGFEMSPAQESDFQTKVGATKVQDPVSTLNGQATDAQSRRLGIIQDVMGTDKRAMAESEAARAQRNIDRTVQLTDPGQFEGQQKGLQEQLVSRLTQVYAKTTDPKAREELLRQMAEVTNATGTGERFKVEGDQKLNKGTGESTQTDLGNAKAYKDRQEGDAAKNKVSAEAKDALKAEQVAATESLRSAQRDLQSLRAMTDKVSSKEKDAHKAAITDAEGRVTRYQTQLDDLSTRLRDHNTKGSKSAPSITVVKDNQPAASPAPAARRYDRSGNLITTK